MKKKIMTVLIGFALLPFLMAEMCEGPCELQDVDNANVQLLIILPDACHIKDGDTHEVIFKDDPFDAALTVTAIIGDLSSKSNKKLDPMNINVSPTSSVVFSQGTPFTIDTTYTSDNCAFKILRSNTHIKNISLKNYNTSYGICIYAKGVILENITFEDISDGPALKLFSGASVILKNPTFTNNKSKIDDDNGSYIIMTKNDADCGSWTKLGEGCINHSVNDTVYNSFNDYISNKGLLNTSVCGESAIFSASGCVCLEDFMDDPDKDGLNCVACSGTDKKIKDGKCVCSDDKMTLGTGNVCVNDCGTNEHKKDGACVCDDNYGRYYFDGISPEAFSKNPCVLCGANSTDKTIDGKYCSCMLGFHRSLKGSCVADTVTDCGTNASKIDGVCQCDTCAPYTWIWQDAATGTVNQAAVDAGPSCVKNSDTCAAPLDCNAMGLQLKKKLVANADNTACVEVGASGSGDCQLNPSATTTALQAMLPFIGILASSVILSFPRRRESR